MKVSRISLMLFLTMILSCVSCTNETDEFDSSTDIAQEVISQYENLSNKTTVSALSLTIGGVSRFNLDDCAIGLTQEDVEYLSSLSDDELLALKSQIMAKWGLTSDEEISRILDEINDDASSEMSSEELIAFEEFINDYIESPSGSESLKRNINTRKISSDKSIIYAQAAIGIDRFGRKLYEAQVHKDETAQTLVTVRQCEKYFAARISISSCNLVWGLALGAGLPGIGWVGTALVGAAATVEAIDAYLVYRRCMKYARE